MCFRCILLLVDFWSSIIIVLLLVSVVIYDTDYCQVNSSDVLSSTLFGRRNTRKPPRSKLQLATVVRNSSRRTAARDELRPLNWQCARSVRPRRPGSRTSHLLGCRNDRFDVITTGDPVAVPGRTQYKCRPSDTTKPLSLLSEAIIAIFRGRSFDSDRSIGSYTSTMNRYLLAAMVLAGIATDLGLCSGVSHGHRFIIWFALSIRPTTFS